MKTLQIALLALLCALAAPAIAQGPPCTYGSLSTCSNGPQTITVSGSGGAITIPSNGGLTPSFEYAIVGTPATMSIVAVGYGALGTAVTLDTYTGTSSTIRTPTVSAPYVYYTVTATWTGGSGVSIAVSTNISTAHKSSPGGGGNVTGPSSAAPGNFPVLDSTGKVLSDSEYSPSSFESASAGAAEVSRAEAAEAANLPLAGGTLSGTLNGRSAAFSGSVAAGTTVATPLIAFSDGTQQSSAAAQRAPAVANQLLFSPLSSYVAPTVGTATLGFQRNFNCSQQTSTGVWSDAAHLTACYTYFPALLRNVQKLTGPTPNAAMYSSLIKGASDTCNRDFTQAEWVKTNITAAKNQTGIQNDANAASSLTATGANGTALFSITTASAVRTFSAFVKRIAGGGRVWITRDGGTSYVDITAQLNPASYSRVSLTSTVLNPTVGFMLETSGDAIAVDAANDTNTPTLADPLVVRTDDVQGSTMTFSAMAPAPVAGRVYYLSAYATVTLDGGSAQLAVQSTGAAYARLFYSGALTFNFASNNGSAVQYNNMFTLSGVPWSVGTEHKLGIIFGNGQMEAIIDDKAVSVGDSQKLDPVGLSQVQLSGAALMRDLDLRELRPRNVVLLGDSMTASANYPSMFRAAFSPLNFQFHGRGVSGNLITDVTARLAADVTPYFNARATNNTVILRIATNSLAANVSAATALTQMQALINAIQAGAAWDRIILVNCVKRGSATAGGWSNGATYTSFETQRVLFNAGLSALSGVYAVADVASIPELQDPTVLTYFDSFQIHSTPVADQILFPVIAKYLQ